MKKLFAAFLAFLIILPLFLTSCTYDKGAQDTSQNTSDQIASTGDESEIPPEVKKLNGREFVFLVRETQYTHLNTNEIYADIETGDKVNDAVYKRNRMIEDTYNCKITEERDTNPTNRIKDSLVAGEYVYDFMYHTVTSMKTLANSNLLLDFNTFENISLGKSWWDQNAIKGLSIGNKLFFLCGEAITMDDRATSICLFNKQMFTDKKLENPYDLVRNGTWTIAKFYEMMLAGAEDKDGDGIIGNKGVDIFGYIGEPVNAWVHVAACGVTLSVRDEKDFPVIPDSPSKELLDAWGKVHDVLSSSVRDVSDSGSRFRKGLGLFFIINAGALLNFPAMETDFGILPIPKGDEKQENYYTTIDHSIFCALAIPYTVKDPEMAAYLLELLSYYSQETLTVAFYEEVLKGQIMRDVESREMLDILFNNRIYDIAVIYNWGSIGNVFRDAALQEASVLASTYASRVSAAQKSLSEFIEFLKNL